jgi:hypothetical protein
VAAVCDVACNQSSDCLALGPGFSCSAGACRESAALAGGFSRACTTDSQCAAGLRCIDNTCSQPCTDASDCGVPGAVCETYEILSDGSQLQHCLLRCERSEADPEGRDQCSILGAGGRCTGETCRETRTGLCGDVGQPGSQWSCYEDIAADVFRERHGLLQAAELCLPTVEGRLGTIEYRRCADSTCASGESGCPVRGLVLESRRVPATRTTLSMEPLLSARGEVQLREPVRVQLALLDPVETCEYTVGVRFFNIELSDGFRYLSPYTADQTRLAEPGPRGDANLLSTEAIDGGFWQLTHDMELGHVDSASGGAIIEDSAANVGLLSGGERCVTLQAHVGIVTRDSLTGVVNDALDSWGDSLSDTLECTPCGQPGCELSCRYR